MINAPKNRFSGNALEEVTPSQIKQALRAATKGKPAKWFQVLEFFLKHDEEISPALQSLTAAVLQEDLQFVPMDESQEAARQAEALRMVMENLDYESLFKHLLMGHYFGFEAAMPVWDMYEGFQAPVTYEVLPKEWIYADRQNRGQGFTTLYVGDMPLHEIPDGDVLIFSAAKLPSFTDIDFSKFGVGTATARFACYSWFNHIDWAGFNEAFGTPTILGTLLQGWSEKDKDLLQNAVFGIGNDSRGIITDRTKVDIMEAQKYGSVNVFERADEIWRIARSRIIKSESLTDNMGSHGSNAAMLTVNNIRLDVAQEKAKRLTRLVNRKLVKPFLERNFTKPLAAIKLIVKGSSNLVQELQVDKTLLEMGVPLSKKELYQRYGRTEPVETNDTITKAANNLFSGF
jgi:phage gp29-like protein